MFIKTKNCFPKQNTLVRRVVLFSIFAILFTTCHSIRELDSPSLFMLLHYYAPQSLWKNPTVCLLKKRKEGK